jgi:hypothetical protein
MLPRSRRHRPGRSCRAAGAPPWSHQSIGAPNGHEFCQRTSIKSIQFAVTALLVTPTVNRPPKAAIRVDTGGRAHPTLDGPENSVVKGSKTWRQCLEKVQATVWRPNRVVTPASAEVARTALGCRSWRVCAAPPATGRRCGDRIKADWALLAAQHMKAPVHRPSRSETAVPRGSFQRHVDGTLSYRAALVETWGRLREGDRRHMATWGTIPPSERPAVTMTSLRLRRIGGRQRSAGRRQAAEGTAMV